MQAYIDGLPIFTQSAFGWSNSEVGIMLGILGLTAPIVNTIVGSFSSRVPDRYITVSKSLPTHQPDMLRVTCRRCQAVQHVAIWISDCPMHQEAHRLQLPPPVSSCPFTGLSRPSVFGTFPCIIYICLKLAVTGPGGYHSHCWSRVLCSDERTIPYDQLLHRRHSGLHGNHCP